jgi:MFS transporter, DHA1 family, tetracycline resistance protein
VDKTKKKKFFKDIAPCLFAIFIDILSFGLVTPLLILFFTSSDDLFGIASPSLRYLYLGIALAIHPLLMFFGTSFIGDLSDIIGRKKTLLFSMLGMTFSFFLMSLGILILNLPLFFIGRGLSGLVSASQSVALATLSDLSTKENKAIHLSYVALVQSFGLVVGPLLGGTLSEISFYVPFLWSGLFALVAFFWIAFVFEETFKKSHKSISLSRVFKVFSEAYQNRRTRLLSLIFLCMQVGVGIYFTVVSILLVTRFQYGPLYLGLFNGYLGLGFALGLSLLLPRMLKVFTIETVVAMTLVTTALSQFFSSLLPFQAALWIFGFPFAVSVETAFSGMFTSFSNAADEHSQGWVMGISVAILAISWAISGFTIQLVQLWGAYPLLLSGSLLVGISAYLMKNYCQKYTEIS